MNLIERKQFPYLGQRLGKLIITTCKQSESAPFIDDSWTHDREGNRYVSKAIVWPFGKSKSRRRAFVIGWRISKDDKS